MVLSRGNMALGLLAAIMCAGAAEARADVFGAYVLDRTVTLPSGVSSFDVLPDGRMVAMVNATVYAETASGAGTFTALGALAGADIAPGSYATAFMAASPDGTRIAVGNNGGSSLANYEVGVFDLATLTGDWFAAHHYQAAWIDSTSLALTAGTFGSPSEVTALDTASSPAAPVKAVLVTNIGGSSGGVAFDAAGRLYTANGYAGAGPSATGDIKAFAPADWQSALAGGPALDFEAEGVHVAELLSGQSLGFDGAGNLHVGGGDFAEDYGFAALVSADGLAAALAGGAPIDASDAGIVQQFDPDTANGFNYYDVTYNDATGELLGREGSSVYVYAIPEPAGLLLLGVGLLLASTRRRAQERNR